MHPVLDQARNPYGERRFYPLGAHPAAYRSREMLKKLTEVGLEHSEQADYLRQQIAVVEDGELFAQRRYLMAHGVETAPLPEPQRVYDGA